MILEARGILDTDKIKELTERFRKVLYSSLPGDRDKDTGFMCAASLAHHGLLSSVDRLWLSDDLSPVPAQHLASLVSCVTFSLHIKNVSGCDLVSILNSLKCEWLDISSQSLGREETQALVKAMESRVEDVILGDDESKGTLDIEALTEYSGRGMCTTMKVEKFKGPRVTRYQKQLKSWARSRNWSFRKDGKLDRYTAQSST